MKVILVSAEMDENVNLSVYLTESICFHAFVGTFAYSNTSVSEPSMKLRLAFSFIASHRNIFPNVFKAFRIRIIAFKSDFAFNTYTAAIRPDPFASYRILRTKVPGLRPGHDLVGK